MHISAQLTRCYESLEFTIQLSKEAHDPFPLHDRKHAFPQLALLITSLIAGQTLQKSAPLQQGRTLCLPQCLQSEHGT